MLNVRKIEPLLRIVGSASAIVVRAICSLTDRNVLALHGRYTFRLKNVLGEVVIYSHNQSKSFCNYCNDKLHNEGFLLNLYSLPLLSM